MSASYSSSFVSFGPMKLNALALSLKHQIDGIQHVDEECFSAPHHHEDRLFAALHQSYFSLKSKIKAASELEELIISLHPTFTASDSREQSFFKMSCEAAILRYDFVLLNELISEEASDALDAENFSALRKVANLAKEYFQQEFDHIHQAYFTACSALCENPALENFHEILQRIKQVETLYILSKEPIFDFSIVKEKLLSLQVKSNSLFAQEPQEHVQMQVDKESRKRSAEEELFAPMTTLFKSKASLS